MRVRFEVRLVYYFISKLFRHAIMKHEANYLHGRRAGRHIDVLVRVVADEPPAGGGGLEQRDRHQDITGFGGWRAYLRSKS